MAPRDDMKRARYIILCLIIISTSHASSNPPKVSFTVQGHEIEYKPKQNKSDVIGNARATRTLPPATASQQSRTQILTADCFHINFVNTAEAPTNQQPSQDIDTITAEGNVSFQEGDFSIQAKSCIYDCKANTIICEGNIQLTKGQNTLKGDRAKARLDSGYYYVTAFGESGKVQAVLTPPSHE